MNLEIDNLKSNVINVSKNIQFEEIPKEEHWRLNFVKELSLVKTGNLILPGFSSDEIEDIINFTCIS